MKVFLKISRILKVTEYSWLYFEILKVKSFEESEKNTFLLVNSTLCPVISKPIKPVYSGACTLMYADVSSSSKIP